MMHPDCKMITFMCGENIGCPLMLVCMSEHSDMPLASVLMDMGPSNPCMELCVVCDPNTGMMMVMPMGGSMMSMSSSGSMMGSCMSPMGMGGMGNGMGGMGNSMGGMGMGSMGMGGMGMGGCGNGMNMGNSMGMHSMMSPMMGMNMPMMMGSGNGMMQESMGGGMRMMLGRHNMMRMSKIMLLKLDPMSACMGTNNNSDMMSNAVRIAQPLWHCRLEHMHMHTSVMVCRSPMTNEIVAHENDSGRGMMGGGEQRMGMLAMMMPMRSRDTLSFSLYDEDWTLFLEAASPLLYYIFEAERFVSLMNRPVLNADVLLLIFSAADVQTKLALISTCQVLYREGGKRFPPTKYVRPRTERRPESFLRFMDADGGSRMRSLHTLDISLREQEPSESIAEDLSKMLTRLAPVSRLTELCIYPLETFLSTHPPLSRAIASLSTIEDIRFSEVGERSLELVRSMEAKLTKVIFWGGRYDLFKDAAGGSVVALLHQFSGSLRELCLAGFGDAAHPTADTPEYPLLSALDLEVTSAPIDTWHYVRVFPNLKSLTLRPEPCNGRSNVGGSQLDLEFRTQNRAQLRAYGCWESLDTFKGSIPALWGLGLPSQCHVRCMEVCDKDTEEDPDMTAEMLRDVLCAARPARLELTICYSDTLRAPATGVADALVEACGATLQEFVLTVEVTPPDHDERYTSLHDVMDAVGDMLRGFSRLADVSVIVAFEPATGRPQRYDYSMAWWGTPPSASAVEDKGGYQEMDADDWCNALRHDVPFADFVNFFVFDHRTMGDAGAQYERDEWIRWWE
ncbi:hypothetical protein V8D89_008547 [Ganoderma adspersum]